MVLNCPNRLQFILFSEQQLSKLVYSFLQQTFFRYLHQIKKKKTTAELLAYD